VKWLGVPMGTERFTIGSFTIPIVKRSFLKRIFIFFLAELKEHFTIGKKEKEKGCYRYSKMTYSKTHL
jgi:hypothetical protein